MIGLARRPDRIAGQPAQATSRRRRVLYCPLILL